MTIYILKSEICDKCEKRKKVVDFNGGIMLCQFCIKEIMDKGNMNKVSYYSNLDIKIYNYIKQNKEITQKEIEARFRKPHSTVSDCLIRLVEELLISFITIKNKTGPPIKHYDLIDKTLSIEEYFRNQRKK